ncbi:hypothetical protein [Alcaligenes sp. WGS1538]|uniref:hypothetical protein n=1 Tax=Alcaligenes sp. WGS1538 TaxID=3366811 RepID=UPI00372D53C9
MKITNLTNSPYDLVDSQGRKVRLAARGVVEGFEPHPMHIGTYRALGYFRIENGHEAAKKVEPASEQKPTVSAVEKSQDEPQSDLREQFKALAGKDADKRWGDARIAEEIEKLKG